MDNDDLLTKRWQAAFMLGDVSGVDDLLRDIEPELRKIAAQRLNREWREPRISQTELVNELWLKKLSKGGWQIENRKAFYMFASHAMGQLLTDRARKMLAARRESETRAVSLSEIGEETATSSQDLEEIVGMWILVGQLAKKNADQARMVEMHYYMGLTLAEISEITALSLKQVDLRVKKGIAWLKKKLRAGRRGPDSPLLDWGV
jgi:RNA polymerase sigma factor (TIGR02999 family)